MILKGMNEIKGYMKIRGNAFYYTLWKKWGMPVVKIHGIHFTTSDLLEAWIANCLKLAMERQREEGAELPDEKTGRIPTSKAFWKAFKEKEGKVAETRNAEGLPQGKKSKGNG